MSVSGVEFLVSSFISGLNILGTIIGPPLASCVLYFLTTLWIVLSSFLNSLAIFFIGTPKCTAKELAKVTSLADSVVLEGFSTKYFLHALQ